MKNKKIIIPITIIISIILVIVVIYTGQEKEVKNKKIDDIENYNLDPEPSRIDYDNLENAKLVDGEKINTSKKFTEKHYALYDKDSSMSKISFTEAKLVSNSNEDASYFTAKLTNEGNTNFLATSLRITLYDKNGKSIGNLFYSVLEDVYPDKSIEISVKYIDDVINAYDYKVSIEDM